MEKCDDDKNFYKKINIIRDSLSYSPLINKEKHPNKTISISKINSPKYIPQKVDSKSQTSSNIVFHTINSRNNINDNQLSFIKELFSNNIEYYNNNKKNSNVLINTIQLDKNHLRLISTKNINNKEIVSLDNSKSNSSILYSHYMNNKKLRADIVKFRFLQSQKNYYKRINNLNDINILKKNINNFKIKFDELKNNSSLKKINNFLLFKNNNLKIKRKENKKDNSSFPSINNSLFSLDKKKIKLNKNNSIIYIKFKDKDIKDDILKNKKYKSINQQTKFFSHRIHYKYNKKMTNNQNNSFNKNNKKTINISHDSRKIINDNYNKYLNDISSSDSDKSNDKKKLKSVNKNIINKLLSKKVKHKIINIKNGLFNLNKNKLNISIQEIKNNENNEKSNKDNNIKSVLKIKKLSIDNNNIPEINKNIIFNPLLRQKLFNE